MNHELRILVVEDDDDDFLLLDQMLKKHPQPTRVDRAASVEDALQFTARRPYDLFLLDYRLGALTGLDLMQRFKDLQLSSPVIFLTGQGDEDVAVAAMKAGATDYLAKSKLTQPALSRAISYAHSLQQKEDAIRQVQREIQARERRFRALVENSSDAITLRDASRRVFYASPSCHSVLGYAPEELMGPHGEKFSHPDDRQALAEAHTLSLARPGLPVNVEYRWRQKDGSWRCIEATGVNRLDDADVRALVVHHRDVSQRKRAENAVKLNERRLEALLELNRMNASSEEEITSFALEQGIGLTGSRYGYVGFVDECEESVVK
ncbi:MAG TPA: response regulator, partial [Terriglobales bacterium]|nr:response regulator [Terriglobales bacterium]